MKKNANQEILKKYFYGLHGLVLNKSKTRAPLTGKVSDSKLVGKSK